MKMNAYFQLDIKDDGVYLELHPAKEGGKPINIQELAEYLDKVNVPGFDIKAINQQLTGLNEVKSFRISTAKISEVNEMAVGRISSDKMMAILRFYPPSKGGKFMDEKEIVNDITNLGVQFGIANNVIAAYMKGRQFCRDIPMAKGTPVVPGTDAKVKYYFKTRPTAKPKLNEDGSVDFHELNMFTSVKKGDLLAELFPEKEGTVGKNVFGTEVFPSKVKKTILKYGKNITISEDNTKIYSDVDGDVRLEGDTVFVSNTYAVPADVDTSTGDIHYNGNVLVNGNVRTGFTIEADGDVEVNGVVEGATIISGGSIVLKRGAQGMGKGVLKAKGDIVAKFFESCNVYAGHTINTGSALHCELEAGDDIIISGRKGFLIGGNASAGKKIDASVFGNKMNTHTNLKVGVDPEVMERYKELTIMIKQKQEDMLKAKQVIESLKKKVKEGLKLLPNQMQMLKQATEEYKTLNAELESSAEEYNELKMLIEENTDGRIVVNNTIFPGVHITISNRQLPIKDIRSRCMFKANGADVEALPL